MIRQEAFDEAKRMEPFLETQFTPEQFNSWRKSIDSNKNWTEEEKKYLKLFVDTEEEFKTWARSVNKSDKTLEEKEAALSLIREIRRNMGLLR